MSVAPLESTLSADLATLASAEAAGRLAGSDGAKRVARYLARCLYDEGIGPAGRFGYFTPVTVFQSRLVALPVLRVNGSPLRHRREFTPRPEITTSGRAAGKLAVISQAGDAGDSFRDRVLLLPQPVAGGVLREIAEVARSAGARALLVPEATRRGWLRKSVVPARAVLPTFSVSSEIAASLMNRTGATIDFETTIESGAVICSNVLGLIRGGRATGATILLSAHYDHVGDDPDGLRFPGAFDNASGVAVVLAAAREIARRRESMRADVMVAFLTGEESGLWGARTLVDTTPLPLSLAMNIDGVGSESLRALRVGSVDHQAASIAARVVERRDILARRIAGRDDSLVFWRAGIPTIGFGQEPGERDLTFMHSPDDSYDGLDPSALEEMVDIVCEILTAWTGERGGPS